MTLLERGAYYKARVREFSVDQLQQILTPKQFYAIKLHYIDGKSVSEIADIENVHVSCITRRLQKARETLRIEIKEHDEDE